MKQTAFTLLVAVWLILTSAKVFANYDGAWLKFSIFTPKATTCKEAICANTKPAYTAIQVSNRSLNRYRCTGKIQAQVTVNGSTMTDTIRIDEFINPKVKAFIIKKYDSDNIVSDLDASSVDCSVI